ncbi:MAG: hypothetical protein ACP5UM_12490 [Anaerolineae bacterium]
MSSASFVVALRLPHLSDARQGPLVRVAKVPQTVGNLILIASLPLLIWYPITKATHLQLRAELEKMQR